MGVLVVLHPRPRSLYISSKIRKQSKKIAIKTLGMTQNPQNLLKIYMIEPKSPLNSAEHFAKIPILD
jgi:hypothetical protein